MTNLYQSTNIHTITSNSNTISINTKPIKKQLTKETLHTQNTLEYWFNTCNPQYFLTVQFPIHKRTTDITKSNKKLHKVMLKFEKLILGKHWYRKHIPFFVIGEHGKYSLNWHYHVLIYDCPFDFFQVQQVFQKVSFQLHLPQEVLMVKQVYSNGVNSYSSKEFTTDINYHFDSDRIITSEILFNLPYKPITRMPESQKQSQNHEN